MSWCLDVMIYLVGIGVILAAILGVSRKSESVNLKAANAKNSTTRDQVKEIVSKEKAVHTLIFEQGGYGLGDNLMGLISLYYLRQVVPSLRERNVKFLFQWPLFEYFERPDGIEILSESVSSAYTTINITHAYFGEYTSEFSYEKLRQEYSHRIKASDYWPEASVILHCNMPLFAFDLDGHSSEKLVQTVFNEWFRPRDFLKQKVKKILDNIQVLYHLRIGDAQLVHDYEVRADHIEAMLSGITELGLTDHSTIFIASDTRDCLSVARKCFPQYQWKGWEDYYESVELQHLTFLDQRKNNDRVLERTLVEFMLFKEVSTVVTQRWSNFSKVGLLANRHPELKIWMLENRDTCVLRQITDKKDLVFK